MAKGNVPKSKDTQKDNGTARELLKQFENLPAEVRHLLIAQSSSAGVLTHVAGGIQHAPDEIKGSASAVELRQAATQVRAQTAHGAQVLFRLETFAGQLEGLAWARDALEQAERFAGG
jgi:hypothetical protein